MTSSPNPQAMQVRRQGGAKRGDHPAFVSGPNRDDDVSVPIGTETPRKISAGPIPIIPTVSDPIATVVPDPALRPPEAKITDATARAKAAYDAKPKVIFRGVDTEVNGKLRAIYKHQLHQPGGIEGWSEWGRTILEAVIENYEHAHGPLVVEPASPLRSGRRPTY